MAGHQFTDTQRQAAESWRSSEAQRDRDFTASENAFQRDHQTALAQGGYRASLFSQAMTSYVGIITSDSTSVDKQGAIERLIAWVNESGGWLDYDPNGGGDTGGNSQGQDDTTDSTRSYSDVYDPGLPPDQVAA